ncbi:MAG: choice-of-anchor D domain-containing protein, partial [Usitatibacter sp.]
ADYGGTEIVENVIGLNSAGTAKLANGGGGVFVEELDGITISGNYISGNSVSGIGFQYASGLDISENVIGLSYGGSPLANTRGIESYCGGYVSIYGNTIKSNQFEGIYLSGGDTADIESNTISDNGTSGVRIDSGSCGYGGLHYASDNTISGNKVDGILVTGSSVGNQFHANSIYGNTRKSINLNNNASTLPNDANDGDGGSNNQQNYPEITEVLQDAGTGNTTISFTLDSIDSTSFDVEFYSNPTPGNPAGREYLGSTTVFVYGGPYSGTFTAYGQLADNVSATATNASTYDTSELSSQKAAISAPAASVSPSNVNFGDVLVNTESATRTVTIRSIGDQPYVIDSIDSYGGFCGGLDQAASVAATPLSICASGSFICETTCDTGTAYSKGQSCRITAKFTPPFNGYQSTALYICDNTSVTPKQVYFEGNGILPPPITVSPRSWDFGAVPIGEAGEPHKFVVSNVGYGSLDLVSLATSGEYDVVNSTCGSFLYGGASCDVVVNFLPTMTGDSPGAFVATYSSYGGLDAGMLSAAQIGPTIYKAGATLTGVGIGGGELILPGPIELGAAVVGGSPVSRTVELRNSGTQPVNIASITISGPFTMVNNCTAPLAPGATCMVTISFTAPSIGDFNGSLTVVSDAAGGSGEIGVHATGQVVAGPLLQITPTAIGFGDRVIGSQSSAQTITITNVGGVTATLSLSTSSLDFLIAGNSCGATLAPQASCSALVAFRPLLGFGSRTGSFIVSSNAANSPQAVALGGTGCRPYVGAGNRSGEGSSSNCAP